MKEIPLSQGLVALVDDDMYEELSQYKWHAYKHRHTYYAIRNVQFYPGCRTTVKMHRQVMRAQSGEIIDHRDGNGLKNIRDNLRSVTNSQNCANRRSHVGSKSQYKGVSWHKQHCKWYSSIWDGKKQIFLGLFEDEIEAAKAYDRKALEVFGEFAKTNFPKEDYMRSA